jgi:hypothetical protein
MIFGKYFRMETRLFILIFFSERLIFSETNILNLVSISELAKKIDADIFKSGSLTNDNNENTVKIERSQCASCAENFIDRA